MVERREIGGDLTEALHETSVGLGLPAQEHCLVDHHDPADRGHDHQQADDHPAVERDRLQDHGEVAREPARGLLVDAEGDELALVRALSDGGELDKAGRPRDLRDLQLVEVAGEARHCRRRRRIRRSRRRCRRSGRVGRGAAARSWRTRGARRWRSCGRRGRRGCRGRAGGLRVAPELGDLVQRRKRRVEIGVGIAVEIERDLSAVEYDSEVVPTVGRDGRAGTAALDRPGIRDLDERRPVVETDDDRIRAVATTVNDRVRLQGRRLDPRRPGQSPVVSERQRWRGRQRQRHAAIEAQAIADDRSIGRQADALRVVGPDRGIERGRPELVEMIDQQRVRVVGAFRIAGGDRFLVAVVEPDVGLGTRLHVRHGHPHQRLAEQAVVLLDVMLERRLVVARDEAQIAAVVLGRAEAEVPDMQPDQHRGHSDRISDIGAGRARIDRDLLAHLPFVVPPRLGGGRNQRGRQREHEQQSGEHPSATTWQRLARMAHMAACLVHFRIRSRCGS